MNPSLLLWLVFWPRQSVRHVHHALPLWRCVGMLTMLVLTVVLANWPVRRTRSTQTHA